MLFKPWRFNRFRARPELVVFYYCSQDVALLMSGASRNRETMYRG